MKKLQADAAGVSWSLVSAFLWSTTFICSRYLLRDGRVDPVTLSMIRFVLGGSVLLGYGLCFHRDRLLSVSAKDMGRLAGLGLLGIVSMSVFLFVGQQTTTAINSSLIMQTNPIMIMFAGVFIGERLRGLQIAGAFIALLGCLLVVEVITAKGLVYNPNHLKGDLFVVIAAASWAVYSVAGKPVVKRLGGMVASTWAMVFGALELVIVWAVFPSILPADRIWPAGSVSWSVIGYLSIFPTAIAFLAWYKAMNRISLPVLNIMQYLTPAFTIVLAWLLLGESITWLKSAGIVTILLGVLLTGLKSKKSRSCV